MKSKLIHICGPFSITSYGVCMLLGLSAFFFGAFFHKDRRLYLSDEQLIDIFSLATLGGLLGGKLLFLLQYGTHVVHSWEALSRIILGGFAILGAMIGALVTVCLYVWHQRLPLWPILDIAGTYALLAHGISRIGCFLAGCCYGMTCAPSWWSVMYTDAHSLAPLGVSLYPTQLMMAGASLIGFLLMRYIVYPMKGRPTGMVIAWYMLYESSMRLFIDFFRGDQAPTPFFFSFHQIAALVLIVGSVGALLLFKRRWR